MYAIIRVKGKQYRVSKGSVIEVDLLGEQPGAVVEFHDVLLSHDAKKTKIGAPTIAGHSVKGKVRGTVAGPKITSLKYKPRHNEYRKFGHRQKYTSVEITSIA